MWWMKMADKIIKNKSSTVNKDCKGTWQCNMTPGIWEREEGVRENIWVSSQNKESNTCTVNSVLAISTVLNSHSIKRPIFDCSINGGLIQCIQGVEEVFVSWRKQQGVENVRVSW